MWTSIKYVAILVALGFGRSLAQSALLAAPQVLWNNQVIPSNPTDSGTGVSKGNGVVLSPDGKQLIVTSVGGVVTSFKAGNGEFLWDYPPVATEGGIVRTHSTMVFTTDNADLPYMVYSIVENENDANPRTRVVALDMDGNELWVSSDLEGVAQGSPVVSDDGHFVFLSHNANFGSVGYFTIVSAEMNGMTFYSSSNETSAFAPVGIYHRPAVGYYDGPNGVDNTNDIIMWTLQPKPQDETIGDGHTFAFQFPVGFGINDTSTDDIGYFMLGDEVRTFQGTTAPKITNDGRSVYFSVTRSGYVCWVGQANLARFHFNRAPTAIAGFERNLNFPGEAVFASPALSSNSTAPIIFGGTASTEFVRLTTTFEEETVVTTQALIKAEAKVDPFDRVVYYVEEDGTIHQADFTTLADIWNYTLGFGVEGEMALSDDGDVLYVADTQGGITALQVAILPETPEPTNATTTAPTSAPTGTTAAPVSESVAPTPALVDATSQATAAPTFFGGSDSLSSTSTPSPTVATGTSPPQPTGTSPSPQTEPSSGATKPLISMTLIATAGFMFV